MAPPATCSPRSMASVSRALRPRPHAATAVRTAAPRLGCGLGTACSMPSYGWRKEEWGSTFAPAPATTVAPVLRNCQILCKAEANIPSNLPESLHTGSSQYEKIVELLTTLFPVWVILGTIIGIYKPSMVTWLETDLFTVGLGLLMLSMGLTLTFEDFRRCMRNPWTVGVGFLAQFLIKPMLGFAIAMTLKLSAPLATGLILVSCCPGGQASNVATYISKGNVALSVLMTTVLPLDFYLPKSTSRIHLLLFLLLSVSCAWRLEGVLLQFYGETEGFQQMTKMISRSETTKSSSF